MGIERYPPREPHPTYKTCIHEIQPGLVEHRLYRTPQVVLYDPDVTQDDRVQFG